MVCDFQGLVRSPNDLHACRPELKKLDCFRGTELRPNRHAEAMWGTPGRGRCPVPPPQSRHIRPRPSHGPVNDAVQAHNLAMHQCA